MSLILSVKPRPSFVVTVLVTFGDAVVTAPVVSVPKAVVLVLSEQVMLVATVAVTLTVAENAACSKRERERE